MIEARGLVKRYGRHLALAGLDLEAGAGDVLGLVGPNGAGKSTTIRILATLVAPDAGQARVGGLDVVADAARLRGMIGYMPERFGLYDELTVEQYLDVFARVYDFQGAERRRQVESVLELTDLVAKRRDPCAGLSKGVRQRLFLAKTLLHDPPVLLLDEPASGLDPQARIDLRALIGVLQEQGKTVLISSHFLSELERLCTRVAVIEGGQLRFAGRSEDVAERLSGAQRVRLRLLDPAAAARAEEVLAGDARARDLERDGLELRFVFAAPREQVPALHRELALAGVALFSFEVESGSLEALFLEVTQGLVA